MIFTLGRRHLLPDGSLPETFFGYYKNDGYVKKQKAGRVARLDRQGRNIWNRIEGEWLDLYRGRKVKDGLSALHAVVGHDEWLCECYMQTGFSRLTNADFQATVNEYLAFLVKNGRYPSLDNSPVETMKLHRNKWREFRFGDLVTDIRKARPFTKDELIVAYDSTDVIPFVTRTADNNGVEMYATRSDVPNSKIEPGNAITIGDTTSTVFYQYADFICGNHIYVVRSDWMNTCTGLFIVTLLRKEQYRYSYGRSFRVDRIKGTRIKLPVNSSGKPDWEFIENYMKSLRYGSSL